MSRQNEQAPGLITIFLCGDVMTGRGIDQIFPHPSKPGLYEPYMRSALGYVELAEKATGLIPGPVDFTYVWGDALDELVRAAPDARIVNIETAITKSEDYLEKGINYRMNPENIACLTAGGVDCCCLANNHILDWGSRGLLDTIDNLKGAGIKHAGAGSSIEEAQAPAILDVGFKGKVIIFSFGDSTSGIPSGWAASPEKPGVSFLENLSQATVRRIGKLVQQVKHAGDVVIVSIHWGANWDFSISREQTHFAHRLIDETGVDVIYGHSSHHIKGIEVYKKKLILYGCGDFLNDYEGIKGHEDFRSDLGLMYFARIDPLTGSLLSLQMTPTQVRHFRVGRVTGADAVWLKSVLNREGRKLGTRAEITIEARLELGWGYDVGTLS